MSKYHIKSKNTNYYLISKEEADGNTVSTADGKNSVPADTTLTITPSVEGSVTIATITGVKGLYVALPKDPVDDSKLIWSKDKYEWVIRLTANVEPSSYQITPADGKDLYWFDKFGIGKIVIVRAGKNVEVPQHYWNLTKA